MTKEFRLPPFDLRLAMDTLAAKDPHLAPLIKDTQEFRIETDGSDSPYEILLEAIAYQSISGKAAATIFGRVKALGANGRAPVGSVRAPRGADLFERVPSGPAADGNDDPQRPAAPAEQQPRSSPSASAGGPIAPSPAGTCGAPASAPAALPYARFDPHPRANLARAPIANPTCANAPAASDCRVRVRCPRI